MLTSRERRLYVWLAAHWARGAGAVVDLGCFVGGSAACLAQGLALAGRDGPVHAYHRFSANESAKEKFLYASGVPPFEGSDTLALAQRLLAPWEGRVALHRGDILKQRWTGAPIPACATPARCAASSAARPVRKPPRRLSRAVRGSCRRAEASGSARCARRPQVPSRSCPR